MPSSLKWHCKASEIHINYEQGYDKAVSGHFSYSVGSCLSSPAGVHSKNTTY